MAPDPNRSVGEAIRRFLDRLVVGDSETFARIVEGIALFGDDAVQPLVRLIEGDGAAGGMEPRVRSRACESLAACGPGGTAALEALARGSGPDEVRREALAALRHGGGAPDGTFARALREERRADVREFAVRSCALAPAFRGILAERAMNDRARAVRLASCDALVRDSFYRSLDQGELRTDVSPLLLRIGAEGTHADVRVRALEHIGRGCLVLDEQEPAVRLLGLAADDPDPEVRSAARLALRRNGVDEPPASRRLMVATIACAWEGRYDRVARWIEVLRSLHFRRSSLDSRIFGREAGTDLAVSLLPMLLSPVEAERRAATWFLLDVCVGVYVPSDWRAACLDRMAALAASDENPPWAPRDVGDLFLAHANRDPRAERALHVLLGLFDGWDALPQTDFLTSWRWTLADSPRPIGWTVVAGAIVHAERREELRGPTRAFLREVAQARPGLSGIARLGLEALASEEPVPEYDPVDVRHGLADAAPAERAERLFRWGRELPGRTLTRRQWTTVAEAISPGAAGDRILSQLGRVRSRPDALRLLRHAERIASRAGRGSGAGRPRSSELMREYREWLDDDLDWEAWIRREREEAFQEQLAEQRTYTWGELAVQEAREPANLGQRLLSSPQPLLPLAAEARLRDVPGARGFLEDWRRLPEWQPRLPDDPVLAPAVERLLQRPEDEPLADAGEIEALAWLEAEGEPTPWTVGQVAVADLCRTMRPPPRSEEHQRRVYRAVTTRLTEIPHAVRQQVLRSLYRMHPEWIPLALHLASGSRDLPPAFRQAHAAVQGSVLALEVTRLSDIDRFQAVIQTSWGQVVSAARRALADQEPEDAEDDFDPAEHLDAPLEEWLQDFADETSRSAGPLLWAGAATVWGLDYPSFELVSRPSVSMVHPEVVGEAVAICDELEALGRAVGPGKGRSTNVERNAHLFDPAREAPASRDLRIGGVEEVLEPLMLALDGGRALVDEGAPVPGVGVLTEWSDRQEIMGEIGRHAVAFASLRFQLLPRDVLRIRARHIRRFWDRVDELPTGPPRTLADLGARWGTDALLASLAHAMLHQARQQRRESADVRAFRREMWHYCVRLISLIRGLRFQAPHELEALRQFATGTLIEDEHGGYEDVDGHARVLLDHLGRRIFGGPQELCQALGIAGQGLPRLAGGRLTSVERRFGALRRRMSLGQDGAAGEEGTRLECRPLPKSLALMRGALGGDCSSATVPLRALLPHYTYYGVFLDGEQQRGYMTVVEAWARDHEGEVSRVLCLETINVPIRAFDAVQQDLLLLFDCIARSRGLDGLVMIHDASTWNYSNETAIRSSRRVSSGWQVTIEPADPGVFSAYELLAPQEAGTYCPFRAGLEYTRLEPFDPEVDRVQPENLAEAARLGGLSPRTPVETCWSGGEAVGFISAMPEPDPE